MMRQILEVPCILTNMELYAEDGIHRATWPPMPWFVLVMFRWRYIPLHKGAWRFSSCDQYGYPKELPFVWTFAIFQLSLQFSSCMYTRFMLVPRLQVWTLLSLISLISIIFAADMAFSKYFKSVDGSSTIAKWRQHPAQIISYTTFWLQQLYIHLRSFQFLHLTRSLTFLERCSSVKCHPSNVQQDNKSASEQNPKMRG